MPPSPPPLPVFGPHSPTALRGWLAPFLFLSSTKVSVLAPRFRGASTPTYRRLHLAFAERGPNFTTVKPRP